MALSPYQQLEQEFRRLHAFRSAASILRWDSAVMMPRGSSDLRGEQLAALETESHALLVSPRVSRLIERADANAQMLEDWQIANLHEMRRERDHSIATPRSLVSRLAKVTSKAEVKWLEAKQKSDFSIFAPHLEEVIGLLRDKASLLGKALNLDPYDALADEFSPGLRSEQIDTVFTALGRRLPGLIHEVIEHQERRPALEITGRFSTSKQRGLATELMKAFGFPFDRGRLDESEHPFTGGAPGDIRITTRFSASEPLTGLMGVLHETGHAMYDVGLPEAWRGLPVGRDRGMAMQESQSLLLEMLICRNRPFLQYLKPLLEKAFGVSGPEWEVENLYRLLTRVRRSLVRVDADEVTYPVHILLRYELETEILRGELRVKDLPEVWNTRIEDRLGVRPSNDSEGCLQDVHWAVGSFGYFPSYAMGGVIAAQLYESLRADRPELDQEIAAGHFAGLFDWLKQNVHGLGASISMPELIQRATGKPLTAAAWLRYAEGKYLE
ncbi:carboxypeptidase M32 [Povalibacter sp.]|uniref:carboxypeptidase M32 n=1 Tax=Povalibacter sp. TaxID=1962978 RepID=UPI002F4197F9